MRFKIGQKVTYNGFAIFGETGANWVGRIGRHHHKKSNRLVVRGEIPGENAKFELYLTTVKPYLQLP